MSEPGRVTPLDITQFLAALLQRQISGAVDAAIDALIEAAPNTEANRYSMTAGFYDAIAKSCAHKAQMARGFKELEAKNAKARR